MALKFLNKYPRKYSGSHYAEFVTEKWETIVKRNIVISACLHKFGKFPQNRESLILYFLNHLFG